MLKFYFFDLYQFDCTNTLNDQVLEKVTVGMEPGDGFEVIKYIPCASLPYDTPGTTYTLVRLPEDPTMGKLLCIIVILKILSYCQWLAI